MSRQDQYSVTVTIGGIDFGTWDTLSGGEIDSEENTYRPGGMAEAISLGGAVTVGAVTVSRLYDLAIDHANVKKYSAAVGSAKAVVKKTALGVDKKPVGDPLIYTGTLKSVSFPEHDSTSSDPGMIELEITPSGGIG
jgi:hypothetical protein